ncbi:ABC transporter ATP-binding protein [Devosia enhydra]|uniref:ABC transporter ATP-binding protein n=1 Tax=Devosia enhydra TaxID=665118 RepID=UPI001AED01A3|nr:ABC transporter ATP-binding protein [Devosia enhydra]
MEIPLKGVNASSLDDERLVVRGRQSFLLALNSIDFTMRRGERVGILGSNGSGKTTLLRLISGLLPADSGSVRVSGSVRPLITIGAGTLPALTGRQNAKMRYGLLELRATTLAEYVSSVESFAELGGFFDLPVGTYSPGMLSRLQFAMSTIEPADILILDEWLGVADKDFHDRARERLLRFADQSECLLLASHDERLLDELTTRKVVLDRGRLISDTI